MPDSGTASDVLSDRAARAAAQAPSIRSVFRLAAGCGIPVWLVGGSVRDLMLNVTVHDLDFAVDGDGLVIARAVADRLHGAYVPLDRERRTGRAILTAAGADPGAPVVYLDFAALRGPDLKSDLQDRDFTLNAIALEERAGGEFQIVDPLGGTEDLANRVLRAPTPHTFASDPVRTLRGVRLQAQFGFTIESQTREWLQEAVPLVNTVSAERIRDEWFKILQQPTAAGALRTMHTLGLLHIVAPPAAGLSGLEVPNDRQDALNLALGAVEAMERLWGALPTVLHPLERWIRQRYSAPVCDERSGLAVIKCAALLHDVGRVQDPTGTREAQARAGGETALQLARTWRCSNVEAQMLRLAIQEHIQVADMAAGPDPDRRAIYRFFRRSGEYGVDAAFVALAVHMARHPQPGSGGERLAQTAARLWAAYFEQYEQLINPPLLLGGEDLVRLGLPPGPQMGALLARLHEAQAAGEIETRQQALAHVRLWLSE